MPVRATCLAAALTLTLPLPALASDADGQFAVDGIGRAACSDLIAAVETEDLPALNAFGSWTSGFLSATNALSDQTFDVTPWQTEALILTQLRNFCAQNPDTLFVRAVGRLVQSLAPARLVASSKMQTVGEGDEAIALYQTVVQGVRDALTEAGFPPAEGDAGLAQALTDYQADRGIEQTGLPDQRTLTTLFLR